MEFFKGFLNKKDKKKEEIETSNSNSEEKKIISVGQEDMFDSNLSEEEKGKILKNRTDREDMWI